MNSLAWSKLITVQKTIIIDNNRLLCQGGGGGGGGGGGHLVHFRILHNDLMSAFFTLTINASRTINIDHFFNDQ